jgi:PAS domain S-box-containing protein
VRFTQDRDPETIHDRPKIPQQLYAAQVRQLYSQAGPAMIGAFTSGVILVVALRNIIPHSSLITWFAIYALINLTRWFLISQYKREPPSDEAARLWDRRFTVITSLAGLMWGLAGVLFFPVEVRYQFMVALFISGISASAVVVFAPTTCYVPVILAQLTPVSLRYIYEGGELNIIVGSVILIYAMVLIVTGKHIHMIDADTLSLRFEKSALVEFLSEEKARIERLNDELKGEIYIRKQTETALRASEKKYKEFAEFLPQIVYETDCDGNFTFLNRNGLEAFGSASSHFAAGINVADMVHVEDREAFLDSIKKVLADERPAGDQYRILKKDGGALPVVTYLSPIKEGDKIIGIRGVAVDITDLIRMQNELHAANTQLEDRVRARTALLNEMNAKLLLEIQERKSAEEALGESEAKYRAVVENIEEAYYEVNLAGDMLFFNDSLCRILGYTRQELTGMNYKNFVDPASVNEVFKKFNTSYEIGKPVAISGGDFVTKDGARRGVETSISLMKDAQNVPRGFRGIIRDVTERQDLQRQLFEAQKMEAIGTLAGGIAHDFNNILFVIIGFTELALEDTPEESVLHSNLEAVLISAKRARDLVRQILTFSRQRVEKKGPIYVAPLVKETIKFLRASLPATIRIKQKIAPDLKPILADPTQIHQILMNLCTNACHAMKNTGGALSVTLECVHPASEDPKLSLQGDSYLKLAVSDTGVGIPANLTDRIFEPYFTTKKIDGGTGLGLAVVHGIVKSYNGALAVKSEEGLGTTFEIFLPTAELEEFTDHPVGELIRGGSERILLVDDEPVIIKMGAEILGSLGYKVTTGAGSLKAIELFRRNPHDFDLVITDMTMPDATGIDLAGAIKKIRPEIPIIVCTGFSELLEDKDHHDLPIDAIVTKPLLKSELAEIVRRVLDKTE